MIRLAIVLITIFILATTAWAQTLHGVTDGLSGSAAGGGCSNSLDFSQACNSMYLL